MNRELTKQERIDMIELFYCGIFTAARTIHNDSSYVADMIEYLFDLDNCEPNYNYDQIMNKVKELSSGAEKQKSIRKEIRLLREQLRDNDVFKRNVKTFFEKTLAELNEV